MAPWKLFKLLLFRRCTSDVGSLIRCCICLLLNYIFVLSVYKSSKNCTDFTHHSFKTLYFCSFYSLHLTIIYFKRRHWELNKFSINSFLSFFVYHVMSLTLFVSFCFSCIRSWAFQTIGLLIVFRSFCGSDMVCRMVTRLCLLYPWQSTEVTDVA